jgi:arylsulfatase A-like enzyme
MRDDLAWFQGIIRYMDKAVERILDAVDEAGMADDSIVIFTSDHGIPYIGAKWTLFDPGISIPLIVRWPEGGITGGRVVEQMMSNVDFMPTLLELAGVAAPDGLQGVSGASLLRDDSDEPIRDAVFAEQQAHALRDNTSRCIRTERYKLIRNFEPGRTILKPIDVDPQAVAEHVERPRRNGNRPFGQLFDLEKDPVEEHDLSEDPEYSEVFRELSDRLWRWMEEVEDPMLEGPIRTPYYERAMEDYKRYRGE